MVLREVSKIDVNYVKKLYKEAFPIRERMPFSRLLKLQKNNIIKMFAAYENGEPCALAITCTGSKSVLLMYLAVDGNKRGQGLGSKIYPRPVRDFPAPQSPARNRKTGRKQADDCSQKGILSSLRTSRDGDGDISRRSSDGDSHKRRRRVRQIRISRYLPQTFRKKNDKAAAENQIN